VKNLKQKYNLLTIIYISFFLIAVILLNVIAGILTDRANWRWDMTADNRFALQNSTFRMLDLVSDTPIRITVFEEEHVIRDHELTVVLYEQLRRYGSQSNITVEYVNPDINPARVREYIDAFPQTQRSSVGVRNMSTGVHWVIDETDFADFTRYIQARQMGLPSDIANIDILSEGVINAAILFVTNETTPLVAFIVGHESTFPDEQVAAMRKDDLYRAMRRANIKLLM